MEEQFFCEVGQHFANSVNRCYICPKKVCRAHSGNPNALPGEYMACPAHADHVNLINKRDGEYRALVAIRDELSASPAPIKKALRMVQRIIDEF